MKTYIVRHEGITAVWYNGQILSAWDKAGDSVNLFLAYVVTKRLVVDED